MIYLLAEGSAWVHTSHPQGSVVLVRYPGGHVGLLGLSHLVGHGSKGGTGLTLYKWS